MRETGDPTIKIRRPESLILPRVRNSCAWEVNVIEIERSGRVGMYGPLRHLELSINNLGVANGHSPLSYA